MKSDIAKELESATKRIRQALQKSPKCTAGLAARNFVYGIECGPSSGPEILACLYADDPSFDFFYGHIFQFPCQEKTFLSVIVWATRFINADTVPLLFQRFHYWIVERFAIQPCAVQNREDAYAESASLEAAAAELVRMIEGFDFDKRSGIEGTGYEESPGEFRTVFLYDFGNKLVKSLEPGFEFPPLPMPMEPKSVKNRE